MGPAGSSMSRVGIMVTDSAYVVVSMHIMTRVGQVALAAMRRDDDFIAACTRWAISRPSGGDRALPRGKAHLVRRLRLRRQRAARQEVPRAPLALRAGAQEGWLAEHMLIIGVEDPRAASPISPPRCRAPPARRTSPMVESKLPGWRVWTIGDDIAWMHVDAQGQLRAINPESGFFGVAPEHQSQDESQRHRDGALEHHLHQRRADAVRRAVVGGLTPEPPAACSTGRAGHGRRARRRPRIPTRASPCPCSSARRCRRLGRSAGRADLRLIFGSRRTQVIPLVFEAFDWTHGVFLGSAMSTETTAAITGQVGVVRRDPMAMLPFCGYNMGDYFAHWLGMQQRLTRRRSCSA
jgi:phosphoenolpyruvate carboxykinase (GTP)